MLACICKILQFSNNLLLVAAAVDRYKQSRLAKSHNDTRLTAMSRIQDMWEQFSVDEYVPRSTFKPSPKLKRSNSLTNLQTGAKPWKKEITVPKPFAMSLRDTNKTPRKTKAMLELEYEREERKKQEELECQKKFKAKPLPAHVYLPLYDEMNEEMESRRRYIVEHSQEFLRSLQKPFDFFQREEERKKEKKTTTMANINTDKSKSSFKAHPFPAHIFDGSASEKIQEEEEYRKIRIRMRAKELLKSASLPPTMMLKGKDYTEGKSRQRLNAEKAKRAGVTAEHKFQPKINESIPDFEEQHRKLIYQMAQKKTENETTVCKPFNLRTSAITSRKRNVDGSSSRVGKSLNKENTWSPSSRLMTARGPGEMTNIILLLIFITCHKVRIVII